MQKGVFVQLAKESSCSGDVYDFFVLIALLSRNK